MTNKEEYVQLCQNEPSICVYDQPWWLDAVCGSEDWDVLLYKKNDQIMGTLTYFVKQKMGLRYVTQPRFTQHNGVWIKYPSYQAEAKRLSMEKEIITNLIYQLEKLPICFYQQNHSPSLTNWQPFYWKGYRQTTNYTYRLNDIRDIDGVFSGFQSNKRKSIRKAKKEGFRIYFDLPADDFYMLHERCLAKQGQTISYSQNLFYRMYQAAYEHKQGRTIYLVNDRDIPICALFDLWDARWGYNLINAIDPDSRSSGASDFLLFSMLEYFSDKVIGFDFEGSMIEQNEESIRRFGGQQTPYFKIQKIYTKNPIIRAAIRQNLF